MPGTTHYLVRKASEHEAVRIAEIQVETWREAYRGMVPEDYLESLDPHRRSVMWKEILASPEATVLVALRESRIVGFCSQLPSRDSPPSAEIAEISSLYVEPSSWDCGAGRSLMTAALDQAREHGFTIVTLWVLSSNQRGRSFYEKAGFRQDGSERTTDRMGFNLHEIRYRKVL